MVALENVLNDCDEISQVFKSNISAAYRSEAQLEAARQTDRDALDQQLLPTPVSYTAPYVQFPWNLIGAEQAKICSKINDSLIPLDYSTKSLKHSSTLTSCVTASLSQSASCASPSSTIPVRSHSNNKFYLWMLVPGLLKMNLHFKTFSKSSVCFATAPIIKNKL